MTKSNDTYLPTRNSFDETSVISAANDCAEAFTNRFNARDLIGMDATLHFPHVILSDELQIIWNAPGNLKHTFFDELASSTGWHHSAYQEKTPLLISPRKVHLLVRYSRNREDGTIISSHENLWIITLENDRWGIKLRSY